MSDILTIFTMIFLWFWCIIILAAIGIQIINYFISE